MARPPLKARKSQELPLIELSDPTGQDWVKLKRLTRHLKGHPRCVIKDKYQEYHDKLDVWVDSDFAGCKKSRKSISGGVIVFGHCPIKTWSPNQAVIALSSGEAEYAMVKGASVGIGIVNMLCDLGMDKERIRLKTDSSAALGIAHRLLLLLVLLLLLNQRHSF